MVKYLYQLVANRRRRNVELAGLVVTVTDV
jgi:hypothetical protein